MLWFQHDSNAHNDIKLKRLRKKYGVKGLGAWWILLEIVAKEGIEGYLEFSKFTFEEYSEIFDLPIEGTKNFINTCGELNLIDQHCLPQAINIPKLVEKADDYAKRILREERTRYRKQVKRVRRVSEESSKGCQDALHIYLSFFINKHKEYIGTGYIPNYGRDYKILKDMLIAYGDKDLKDIIEEFLKASDDINTWWADKVSIPVLRSCAHMVVGRLRKKK